MKQPRILVVDDVPQNITVLNESLKEEYSISAATSGARALEIAGGDPQPDIILLDIMMPEMDGYEVCRQLKANDGTRDIPVIFVTARGEADDETNGLALGAVDYLTKPVNPGIVRARVKNHLELKRAREFLKDQNEILESMVSERTHELSITQDVTIQCMATLAETRDNETGGHIRRTQEYVRTLASELKKTPKHTPQLDSRAIDLLYKCTPLHDIGKVGVPDSILLKPGKLTPDEFEEMKKHATYGRDAIVIAEKRLGTNSFLKYAKEITYTHHEKWDGSGYPEGLAGEDIPLSGRFMAVVDVYDALVSKRVYKPPFPHSKAVGIIIDGSGTHFDPDLVAAFESVTDEFRSIALEHCESEEERTTLKE